VKANFSSPDVLIAPALATGRLTLRTNAMAREVTVGRDGPRDGRRLHRQGERRGPPRGRRRRRARGERARERAAAAQLALDGLPARGSPTRAARSGRYITDTTGTDVVGFVPKLMDHVPHNEDGVGGMHVYMPWWLDNAALAFARGYHVEVWGGLGQPSYGFMGGIQRYPGVGGGYGARLKDDYRRHYGATVGFSGRGEMIPNDRSFAELDPEGGGPLGDPGAALPLGVERPRDRAGQATCRRPSAPRRRDGRHGVRPDAVARGRATASPRRAHHPRAGRGAHGRRPAHLGAQRERPGARRAQPVRRRRRAVRVAGRQEPDVDDPRAAWRTADRITALKRARAI
jgi:hypothetical protein